MSYSLSPLLKPRFFVNATNKPLVGGKLYTYLAETTTPATTYSNDTGTPNTNPIILDTNGECNLYLDDDKVYRLILKDANDVTYFDKDRVSSIGGGDYKVLTFDTIADLRLKIGSPKEPVAQTSGYYAAGDGGGNRFYWDGTSAATDNGGTIIKPTFVSGAGRWLAIEKTVTLESFGVKGNGGFNNSELLNVASAAAISNNLTLKSLVGATYLFNSKDVNFRNVSCDFTGSSFLADNGYKLIIGGNASSSDNKTQKFGKITRNSGMTSVPTCRIIGAKNQTISIERVDFLQLYADTSTSVYNTDFSIAYSTFHINRADKIELTNNASTTGSTVQWINENSFFIKRVTELYINGTYTHNNNVFYVSVS